MAIDLQRTVRAALDAALKDAGSPPPEPKKPFLSTGRALLLGAGAMTAGRLLAGSRGHQLLGSLEERLEGAIGLDIGQEEEPEAEEDEDFEDEEYEEEPEAEDDEDFEDEEYEEEPEAEDDEDFEDEEYEEEPEAEEDEDFDEDEEYEDESDEEDVDDEAPPDEDFDEDEEYEEEPAPKRRRRVPARARR